MSFLYGTTHLSKCDYITFHFVCHLNGIEQLCFSFSVCVSGHQRYRFYLPSGVRAYYHWHLPLLLYLQHNGKIFFISSFTCTYWFCFWCSCWACVLCHDSQLNSSTAAEKTRSNSNNHTFQLNNSTNNIRATYSRERNLPPQRSSLVVVPFTDFEYLATIACK